MPNDHGLNKNASWMPGKEDIVDAVLAIEIEVLSSNKMVHSV